MISCAFPSRMRPFYAATHGSELTERVPYSMLTSIVSFIHQGIDA